LAVLVMNAPNPFARFGRNAEVIERVLRGRGIESLAQIDYRLTALQPPDALSGLERALQRLIVARRAQQRVLVVGDFDCDGATACAIGVRGLRKLGFADVHFRVPHRVRDGYGLSEALIDAVAALKPDLLITADMGVMSHAGVARANACGIEVIVTDHHLPGATLPAALAVINPNLLDDAFPSKALCGAGVLFYLLIALRAAFKNVGIADAERANLGELLDLVALATVADLVPLDFNNRVLVAQGLKRIRAGAMNPGIAALFEVAQRDIKRASAQDLGFAIAPRINAAGRLDDISLGVECLLADDPNQALALARTLDQVNRERRDLQDSMVDAAAEQIVERYPNAAALPPGLVVWDPLWHEGVVGLVASKLKERLRRPVIALAPAQGEVGEWKGSARSVDGVHLRDVLATFDAHTPGVLKRFGGHAMAAGLTIDGQALDALRAGFEREVAAARERAGPLAPEQHDGELKADELTFELATQLAALGPWGQGFPEPRFENRFEIVECKIVGERHRRMILKLSDSPLKFRAMQFFADLDLALKPNDAIRARYALDRDEFRGEWTLGLRLSNVSLDGDRT
jgi:single-stranded-DNA-specific exonuclease